MTAHRFSIGDVLGNRRFATYEAAERRAKQLVRESLRDRFALRLTIFDGWTEIAEVRASGDDRVWVDMKDSHFPAAVGARE